MRAVDNGLWFIRSNPSSIIGELLLSRSTVFLYFTLIYSFSELIIITNNNIKPNSSSSNNNNSSSSLLCRRHHSSNRSRFSFLPSNSFLPPNNSK